MGLMDALSKFRKNVNGKNVDYDYYDDDYADEYEDDFEEEKYQAQPAKPRYTDETKAFSPRSPKIESTTQPTVINLSPKMETKIVIVHPVNFDDAGDIGDLIKGQNPVIVNLDGVDAVVAQRLIDFINGVIHGLGGSIEHISNRNFVAAPPSVQISDQMRETLKTTTGLPHFVKGAARSARLK
ncbi:MAG: cell division protein SepF [Defluviitaleaceae bacterium]|nr:cell division protein SepF [Defluviitaleaceae bacterium]